VPVLLRASRCHDRRDRCHQLDGLDGVHGACRGGLLVVAVRRAVVVRPHRLRRRRVVSLAVLRQLLDKNLEYE